MSSGKHRKRRQVRILGNPLVGILGNPPVLSRQVETVIYRHADDGQTYGHDFGKGVNARLNKDGTVTLTHQKGKRLWEPFEERPYLVNPPKRAKRKRRRAPHRSATRRAKTKAAHRRSAAQKEAQRHMARKSRRKKGRSRSKAVAINRPQHRHVRRNPGFSLRAIPLFVMGSVMDGGQILAGKTVARLVPDLVGVDKNSPAGMGVQALTGLGAGLALEFLLGRGRGRLVFGAALAGLGEQWLKGANVPYLSTALSDWSVSAMPSAFAGYPRRRALAGYPGPRPGMAGADQNPWAVYAQQQ